MTHPRATIITPVYNEAAHLRDTIDSVVAQTCRDLEYILVDDGSTDASPLIIEEYAARYSWITAVTLSNSGSPSLPRNTALDEYARGEFVFFLDADDVLAPEAMADLLAMADESGSDIVLCRMETFGGPPRSIPRAVFKEVRRAEDFVQCFAYRTLGPTKLYRRSLLDKYNIRFPLGYRVGEDQPFTLLAYLSANHVSAINQRVYYWYRTVGADDPAFTNSSRTGQSIHLDLTKSLTSIRIVRNNTAPGPRRDLLLERFLIEPAGIPRSFDNRFLELPSAEQTEHVSRAQEASDLWTEPLRQRAPLKVRATLDSLFNADAREFAAFLKRLNTGNARIVSAFRTGRKSTTLLVAGKGGDLKIEAAKWSETLPAYRLEGSLHLVEVPRRMRASDVKVRFTKAPAAY